jgi:hypothetical protein
MNMMLMRQMAEINRGMERRYKEERRERKREKKRRRKRRDKRNAKRRSMMDLDDHGGKRGGSRVRVFRRRVSAAAAAMTVAVKIADTERESGGDRQTLGGGRSLSEQKLMLVLQC